MKAFSPITLQTDVKAQLAQDLKSLLKIVLVPIFCGYLILYFFNEYTFAWLPFFAVLGLGIFYLGYLIFQDTHSDQTLHVKNNAIEIRKGNQLVKLIEKTEIRFEPIIWKPNQTSELQAVLLNIGNESIVIGSLSLMDNKISSNYFVETTNYYISSENDWSQFNLALKGIGSFPEIKEKAPIQVATPMLVTA